MKQFDPRPPASTNASLPVDSAWLFPEYEFARIDPETHRGVIIERMLEQGSWAHLRWLFATYGEDSVAEWLRLHGFRLLSRRSYALWCLVLGVPRAEAPDWARSAKQMDPW